MATDSEIDEKNYISYNQIHTLLKDSVDRFDLFNKFKPDLIIAIGGGGFIPARILRTFLKSPSRKNIPIQAIGLSLYEELDSISNANEAAVPEEPGVQVTKTQWLNFSGDASVNLLGRRILIIDEVDDTRQTLQYAAQELLADIRRQEAKAGMQSGASGTIIGIFVLHNKEKEKKGVLPPEVEGNYFAAQEVPDRWLVYPWDALDIIAHTEKAEGKSNKVVNS